jgi:hypothetical protein
MDPSMPMNYGQQLPAPPGDRAEVLLEDILQRQLKIAHDLQQQIENAGATGLSPRDRKDLAQAASGIIGLAHRTEESLRIIETYKALFGIVLEFLRNRSDSLGEDLVGELKKTAERLGALGAVKELLPEQLPSG